MEGEEFDSFLAQLRECSDVQAGSAIMKCLLLAPYAGEDYKSFRSQVASELEMTYQGVSRWAYAGSVLQAGIFGEDADQSIEFYAEVAKWPRERWEEVADFALAGGLDASGLKAVRKLAANLAGTTVQSCLVCGK